MQQKIKYSREKLEHKQNMKVLIQIGLVLTRQACHKAPMIAYTGRMKETFTTQNHMIGIRYYHLA